MAVEWIRWYFGKWHGGTKRLSLEERGAYITVCNMIYMEAAKGDRLADDDVEIAYEGRMSLRTWKRLKVALIEKGKFTVKDGVLINERATNESEHAEKLLAQRRTAGSSSAKGRETKDDSEPENNGNSGDDTSNNNDLTTTTVETTDEADASTASRAGAPDKIREEERRKSKGPKGPMSVKETDGGHEAVKENGEDMSSEFAEMVAIWNAFAKEHKLPQKRLKLNATDIRSARLRLAECGGIKGWRDAVASIKDCPFLLGENDTGWRAGFSFLLQRRSLTKLLEGEYTRRPRGLI